MLLDNFPELRRLDDQQRAQLATELWDTTFDHVVELPPVLLAAIEERIAYNEAHPNDVFTTEEFTQRMNALKSRIAARKANA